jgi:hypothetical protein
VAPLSGASEQRPAGRRQGVQCLSEERTLSRGFFRSFQVDLLRLQKRPLRSILIRRVEELDRLYKAS